MFHLSPVKNNSEPHLAFLIDKFLRMLYFGCQIVLINSRTDADFFYLPCFLVFARFF